MSDKWQYVHGTSVRLSPTNSSLILIKIGSDVYSITIHNMYDIMFKTTEFVELRKLIVYDSDALHNSLNSKCCEVGEIAEKL